MDAPGTRDRQWMLALSVVAMTAALVFPASARAVSISVPRDVGLKADAVASLSATEPAGLGLLFVDGSLARTSPVIPSRSTTLSAIPLVPGPHQLRLLVRSSSGLSASPTVLVRAWGVPGTPAFAGKPGPGLARKNVTLVVIPASSTATLCVVLNGKTVWSRAVMPGARYPVPLSLAPGANTAVFLARNPLASAATTLTLTRGVWPVPGYPTVSSGFGMRWGRMHKGIDIQSPYGARVVATGPGRVIWARPLTTYGGLVMIDHGGGMTSYYAHLSRIGVTYGQRVIAGQTIGAVGAAGASHLHFQIFTSAVNDGDSNPYDEVNSGTAEDPLLYVSP